MKESEMNKKESQLTSLMNEQFERAVQIQKNQQKKGHEIVLKSLNEIKNSNFNSSLSISESLVQIRTYYNH